MKVYISKSKMGNPDLLMNLRHLLTHQFEQGIEIKEYFGGVYNSNIIDGSNYLIVCPPHYSIIGQHIIGKGQWSEIRNAQKKDIPVIIFDGNASFNFLHKLTVIDKTDWNAYAKMITGKDITTFLYRLLSIIHLKILKMKNQNDENYVIVRADRAGVFFGQLVKKEGNEVTLNNCRKLYYWSGACAVEELALNGVVNKEDCKFTVTVDNVTINNYLQIIPCSIEAIENLKSVKEWKSK